MFIFIVVYVINIYIRFTIFNFLSEKFITRYNWDYMYLKVSILMMFIYKDGVIKIDCSSVVL